MPYKRNPNAFGYVYLIGNKFYHWYKIGVTQDVHERLRGLQVGCPVQLIKLNWAWVKNPDAVEQNLHTKYSSRRLHGEWFFLPDEDVAEISSYLSVANLKKGT